MRQTHTWRERHTGLLTDIRAEGIATNTEVYIIPFDGSSFPLSSPRDPDEFADANDPAIDAKIDSLFASGGTQFEPPLQEAVDWFSEDIGGGISRFEDHTNVIFFLSDGADNDDFNPTSGSIEDLHDGTIPNLTINAFGFGDPNASNFEPDELDAVETGINDGNDMADHAVIVDDPKDLDSALTAGSLSSLPTASDVIYGGDEDDVIFGDNIAVDDNAAFDADPFDYVDSHLVDEGDPDYDEQLIVLQHGVGETDWIDGGAGNDTIFGQGGDDEILGGSGSDTIYGGSGNDWINGGSGNDTMEGNTGDDMFNDTSGDDTYIYNSPFEGDDIIDGFDNDGASHDTVNLDALFDTLGTPDMDRAGDIMLDDSGSDVVLTIDGVSDFSITFINAVANNAAAFDIGSAASDDIVVS